jgi:adenylate kinase
MERSLPILNELQEISPVVANIGNQVPYQVPQGYFDGLAGLVMQRINAEAGESMELSISKDNVYQVPEGYFEGLAGNIMQRINAEVGESMELSISKDNVYQVPEGYFEGLAGTVLNRIKALEATSAKEELSFLSPLLNKAEKKTPFATPDGYFNDLTGNVVAGVQAIAFVNEELENLSPLMSGLKTKNVYEIPEGYFEQLPGQVLNKIDRQPARVIAMSLGKKMMRYAAAAIVISIVAVSAWLIFKPAGTDSKKVVPAIAKVDIPKEVKAVTDDEILVFAENNSNATVLADINTTAEADLNDTKNLFANVSDDELQHYLEEHGANNNTINTN